MPSQFYLVDEGGAHEIATVPQGVLQAFREDPLECILFDVGRGEAIVVRRKRRAFTVDGGRGLAEKEEEIAGKISPLHDSSESPTSIPYDRESERPATT